MHFERYLARFDEKNLDTLTDVPLTSRQRSSSPSPIPAAHPAALSPSSREASERSSDHRRNHRARQRLSVGSAKKRDQK